MSERDSQQEQQGSPLKTERGTTIIQHTVVARVVGRAAREVEGVHMGGGISRRAGGLFARASDSEPETQGVSVEVGSEEAAVDLKMAIQYGHNLLDVTGAVRDSIKHRIGDWVGLKVTEINITIENILVPEGEGRRNENGDGDDSGEERDESYSGEENDFQREDGPQAQQTEELRAGPVEEDTVDGDTVDEPTAESPYGEYEEERVGDDTREIRTSPTSEGEKTQPLGRETDTDDKGDEEVRVEGEPLEEGERADLRVGQEGIDKHPAAEDSSSSGEAEDDSGRGRRRRRGRNRD